MIFPLTLPPEYSASLAGQYVAQPDRYFLWVYQILKISAFEMAGLPIALSFVTIVFVALVVLPFIDRGKERSMGARQKYVTLGAVFVAEVVVLAIWGYLTPGRGIPNEQAALVLGGTALLVCLGSVLAYCGVFGGVLGLAARWNCGGGGRGASAPPVKPKSLITRSAAMWTAGSFVGLLAAGTYFIGSSVASMVAFAAGGPAGAAIGALALSLGGLALTVVGTMYLVYRLDLGNGTIRRRIRAFEVGWKE